MTIGDNIISFITNRREKMRKSATGPVGDYYRAGGNKLLTSNLKLSSDDVVFDIGAYQGEWTDQILCQYGSRVICYEPVPKHVNELALKYRSNNRVSVIGSAMSDHEGFLPIGINANSSGLNRPGETIQVPTTSITEEIKKYGPKILKINIEGGEYIVLDAVLKNNIASSINCLIIQFHNFESNDEAKASLIISRLSNTHDVIFNFPFMWARFDKRNP